MKSKRLFYTSRIAEVFLEQGYSNMKVEDLALSLGITKKTLYNYFESKKEMVESVLDYISRKRLNEIREGLINQCTPIDALVYVGKSIYNISQELTSTFNPPVELLRSPVVQNTFRERGDELLEIVAFHYSKGVHVGLFDSDLDIELASSYYIFQLENLFNRSNKLLPIIIGQQQIQQLLYYYIKGNCTPLGLEFLRKSFDLRVTAC
jgi:AcrR family transcriptional regulator